MVESSLCRMRLQKYAEIGGGILENLPSHVKASRPSLLRLHITGTPADTIGFSEISAPTTAIANIDTAVAVETISSSASDNQAAGGHAQEIRVIGIQNDKLDNIDLLGHATDWTTFVLHDEVLKEIFHSHVIQWGTGDKDAAGNIDVRNIADAVFVQILAGKNESNGSSFRIPTGHVGMLFGGRLTRLAETIDEGNSIRIIYLDDIDFTTGLVAGDRLNNYLEFVANGAKEQYTTIPKGHMFKAGTWIQFQHSSLVNLGEAYDLTLDFLIWKK